MAVIYGDTSDFKDGPLSSSREFPGRSAQMQHWEYGRALPFGTCLRNPQENTSWKVAETHVFKVTVNTCSRRNWKGWDNFLTVRFGQKLILVGYYLLWRFYSQVKMNPGLGDLLALFQTKWKRRRWGKTRIPSTTLWQSHDVQSFLTSIASCNRKGR